MANAVVYHPITGVPEEYNEFLPNDSVEYRQWKTSLGEGDTSSGKNMDSKVENEKKLPGGKTQKKVAREVVLETTTRNKKKSITTVHGLDAFGVKLSAAAKACGKKFASGASVNKTASGRERIDIQVCAVLTLGHTLVRVRQWYIGRRFVRVARFFAQSIRR